MDRKDTSVERGKIIEAFKETNVSMLCLKCCNYVELTNLQDHRAVHEALSLYQYDIQTKPNDLQTLSRRRATLIKDLNRLDIGRSAYQKKLGKIDLAYEILKSDMYGRSNKAKSSFIEHHDVIISSESDKLHGNVGVGVCESANEKWRSTMEDAYSYMSECISEQTISYFAVFDGYSGSTAANQCSAQFYQILKETFSDFKCVDDADVLASFQQAFDRMDRILLFGAEETSRNRWSGCSATTCLLTEDTLLVANVGNVKAMLVLDDNTFQTLTIDHSPDNKSEKHRIKANGDIHKWSKTVWVNGVVATTRGLGNHGDPILKSNILNVPAFKLTPLAGDVHLLVVASYGFWQVFNENEMVLLIKAWLEENATGLTATENSTKSRGNDSIQITIQDEDVLNAESLNDQTTTQLDHEQECKEKASLSGLLIDCVMRHDSEIVAGGISKHLVKAALTAGSKENITVIVVIRNMFSKVIHDSTCSC
ncbi:probable protein phosphatase 2C 59 [Dendronephthya gigantea]|uniref:probable protein phosphatase 2C 59 n=1 Tax=Dendronephthya gigantea TaxID=151771 RepID=UPI00106C8FAB|nr:probable protein phosphatase 2C 59 [Dendronephthya gigantea]